MELAAGVTMALLGLHLLRAWLMGTPSLGPARVIGTSLQDPASVAFHPHARQIATIGAWSDQTIKLWDLDSGWLLRTLPGHGAAAGGLLFTPDGALLLSAGMDGRVLAWDVATGKQPCTLQTDYPQFSGGLAVSPDGRAYAAPSGPDGQVRVRRVGDGVTLATLRAVSDGTVTSIAFSPDGSHLAVGQLDGRATVWDWRTSTAERVLVDNGGVFGVAYASGGRRLATAGAGFAIWDLRTGRTTVQLPRGPVKAMAVAFSPDDRYLAGGGGTDAYPLDSGVRIWRTRDWKLLWTLPAFGGWPGFAFSADGRSFAATDQHGHAVHIWHLPQAP